MTDEKTITDPVDLDKTISESSTEYDPFDWIM